MGYPTGVHGVGADVAADVFDGSQLTIGYSSNRFDRHIRRGMVKDLSYTVLSSSDNPADAATHLQAAIWKAVAAMGDLAPLSTGGDGAVPTSPIPLAYVRATKFDDDQAWVEAVYQRERGGFDSPDPLTDFRFRGDTETVPVYRDVLRYTAPMGVPTITGPFFHPTTKLPDGDPWKMSPAQTNKETHKPISKPFQVPVHRLFIRRTYAGMIAPNNGIYGLVGSLNDDPVTLNLAGQSFTYDPGTMRMEPFDADPIFDSTTTRFEYIFEFVIREGGHLQQSSYWEPFEVPGGGPPGPNDPAGSWKVAPDVATHRLEVWTGILGGLI